MPMWWADEGSHRPHIGYNKIKENQMGIKGLLSKMFNGCKHTECGDISRVWTETEYGSHWTYCKKCSECGKKVRV